MDKAQYTVPVNRTKLYHPPVTDDYISRDALDARLDAGVEFPLTVVAAPAGYGKSTLVSHWLETRDSPSAWLSLDNSDSDVRVFLSYFLAAIQTISDGVCEKTLNIINSENLPPLPVVIAQLSNDLDELNERLILVLDDYHRIREPAIHLILDSLLEHPPCYLHLVILSRRDPVLSLASLRARHLFNEIRMRDLEFSNDETMSFFRQAIRRPIAPAILNRLHAITEGWPVGIRLAALAVKHQEDVEELLNHFDAEARPWREYLVNEVLSGLPPQVRDCLLKTSILDRFNASLCEAVCNKDNDGNNNPAKAKDFIESLETAGLFCIELDGNRNWFRYHHIFGDLLQKQLEETCRREEIASLHQRASRWFATNSYFEEAIQHALAGDDVEGAVGIVEYARHELMNRDQWHRLERWLMSFSHQTVEQYPQLMVLHCWLDLSHWYRLDVLMEDLDRTDSLLESSTIDAHEAELLKAEVSVIRSSLAYWTINPSLVASLTEPTLRNISGKQEYVESIALMYRAGAYQLLGEVQQAEYLLRNRIEEKRFKSPGSQARIMQALCFIHWGDGNTRKLLQAASRLLEISLQYELSWSHSFARYFLGLTHYECNNLSAAIEQFEVIVNEPYRYPIQNVTHCSFLLCLCKQAQGLPDRARELANSINRLTFERGNRDFIDLAEAFQADLDLRQGRISQAEQWSKNFVVPAPHSIHRFFNAEFTSIRAMLARDTTQTRQLAVEQLDSLHKLMKRSHHRRLMIDLLGMKALLADAAGELDKAVALLQEAVLLGQPGQLIRPLADLGPGIAKLLNRLDLDQEGLQYVGMILSALRDPDPATSLRPDHQSLPEALSQRELEILDLFARNLSNKEIAERLFISTGTVKRHAHNIYRKISVTGRRDAVSKATGLGLLKSS